MEKTIEIYTDGSCVENNNLFNGCGWAFIIPELGVKESAKAYGDHNTTVRMELQAIVKALEFVATHPNSYIIYCDSKSTVGCFKGFGSRKLYKDLWNQVHTLVNQIFNNGSKVKIDYMDRSTLEQDGDKFKFAQEVDRLAFIQANSLEIA